MRVAYFSPMPPARSGIADYSAALVESLKTLAEVEVFADADQAFDPARFDIALYQLGNNPFHTFVYEAALAHPGVIVLHEANLHHLVAAATIAKGDWKRYLAEVEADGGAEALAYARQWVEPLTRGPDYDLPMLKTVLHRSRGVIVHSETVADAARERGYSGPIARIWHGAWSFPAHQVAGDRTRYRDKLGIAAQAPLAGIFGFLKPYKRITESLRAFKRVWEGNPEARLILVGEAHAALPLDRMIRSLGLGSAVRHIEYPQEDDFNGYMAACDAILNLRHPTVGETSGTLLRALSMGKPVVVSEIGAFAEYPDEICLKTPIDPSEEEHIFEYLNLLFNRPQVAAEIGKRARHWVDTECRWELAAQRYVEFLNDVAAGKLVHNPKPLTAPVREEASDCEQAPVEEVVSSEAGADIPALQQEHGRAQVAMVDGSTAAQLASGRESELAEYILSWTRAEDGTRDYAETHLTRLERTLEITPRGGPGDRVLEMGAYLQITPALKHRLGYGEVRGCYFGPAGHTDTKCVTSSTGEKFACDIDLFDAEKDRFPYEDQSLATVLCCELIEHLPNDPVHMLAEINRILKPGGHLVLTTPNITSLRALSGILQGFHPMLYSDYVRPKASGEVDPRHAREYAPREVSDLLENCGFAIELLETGPFRAKPGVEHKWVESLLERYLLTQQHRGEGIYVVGRKTGPVKQRYPDWLYS